MDEFESIRNKEYEERFAAVLERLFGANNITDPNEKIPVFFGDYTNVNSKRRIENITTAWGTPININPFSDKVVNTIVPWGSSFEDNDRIVFIAKCGAMNFRHEIIQVDVYRTFYNLGFENDADYGDVLRVVYHLDDFAEYRSDIKELLEEKDEFANKKTHLDIINEEIEKREEERRNYLEFDTFYKKNYPNGIQPIRNECKNLEEQKTNLKNSVDALTKQTNELNAENTKLQNELSKGKRQNDLLKQAIKEVVPEGKTIEDVLTLVEEYNTHKRDIDEAKKILEWFYGKNIGADNEYALPYEDLTSITFLDNRLDYVYYDNLLIPFMSALATNQIITLFGKPGTGKTTFVKKMAKALGAKCTVISVQNNWTDSSDLLGYYNPVDDKLTSTKFLEALIDAKIDYDNHSKLNDSKLHIICLDEMNLARVEYYFAEFLSSLQLEDSDRWIEVLPAYKEKEIEKLKVKSEHDPKEKKTIEQLGRYSRFCLSPNVRFVGTINSDDTTNTLSPKVIDRSFFIELRQEDYADVRGNLQPEGYYPLSFFQPEQIPCNLKVFENENGRFKHYLQQMYSFYRNSICRDDDDEFISYIILAKILPAIRQIEEFTGSEYYNNKYALAYESFGLHRGSGDYYDYLGSN